MKRTLVVFTMVLAGFVFASSGLAQENKAATDRQSGLSADVSVKAKYGGCYDILSDCLGGRAEANFWLSPQSNFGLYSIGAGATGEVKDPRQQRIWYKYDMGAGVGYRAVSEKNSILINQALVVQMFKNTIFGFGSKQTDLMYLTQVRFRHKLDSKWTAGLEAEVFVPLATMSFSSQLPGETNSNQLRGEVLFFIQRQINNLWSARINAGQNFNAADRLWGNEWSAELARGIFALKFGAQTYLGGIPKFMGIPASELTSGFAELIILF